VILGFQKCRDIYEKKQQYASGGRYISSRDTKRNPKNKPSQLIENYEKQTEILWRRGFMDFEGNFNLIPL
jgi:hypothetical protein